MREFITDLYFMKETAERYVQYMRFAGQNTHVMGVYQYSQYNTPFVPSALANSSRIS